MIPFMIYLYLCLCLFPILFQYLFFFFRVSTFPLGFPLTLSILLYPSHAFPIWCCCNLAYNLLIAIGRTNSNSNNLSPLELSISHSRVPSHRFPHLSVVCDPGLVSVFHRFHKCLLLIPNSVIIQSHTFTPRSLLFPLTLSRRHLMSEAPLPYLPVWMLGCPESQIPNTNPPESRIPHKIEGAYIIPTVSLPLHIPILLNFYAALRIYLCKIGNQTCRWASNAH